MLKICYLWAALLLLLAACSQDETIGDGNTLPEGKYPLQIASVSLSAEVADEPWGASHAPQTRVAEDTDGNSSHWKSGDEITVQLGDKTTTYNVNSDGSLTLKGEQLYWTKRTDNVTAWFPNNGTIDLSQQTGKLAYVLKAVAENAQYNEKVTLSFSHQLAKVRVVFSEESTADLTNASVSILAPISCTVNNGVVTPSSSTDYIPMHKTTYNDGKVCYEANVTPNLTLKDNAFRLVVGDKTVDCSTTEVLTQTGQLHVITLQVNEKVTEININDITETEYTVSGNVHLKGNGQNKNLKLQMAAGSKLTLENVKLSSNNGDAITCNGDASITLKGENSITSNNIGIYVKGGTLTVNGDDTSSMTVTGNGFYSSAGIGATNNANITINGGKIKANENGKQESAGIGSAGWGETCGIITINGGTIESWGGGYSAGIGGSNSGDCGDIIITGGNIKAYGGSQSPGIGNGDSASSGNITISGANTVVYAKKGSGKNPESIGWNNYNGSCGTVTIGTECDVTQE